VLSSGCKGAHAQRGIYSFLLFRSAVTISVIAAGPAAYPSALLHRTEDLSAQPNGMTFVFPAHRTARTFAVT